MSAPTLLEPDHEERTESRKLPVVLAVLAALFVVVVRLSGVELGFFEIPAVRTWTTIFVAIVMQATPFLVFGVLISALIATVVPPSFFAKAMPRNKLAAVPIASVAGAVLPGCECASVPIARRLVSRGVAPAVALTFLLSAPAINPVVIVATAVAFTGQPEMVVARIIASVAVSMIIGLVWTVLGRPEWTLVRQRQEVAGGTRLERFAAESRHDFLNAGGFLVIGAMAAATLNVVVPPQVLDAIASNPVLGILTLAALAVLLAICSEADAFIAASLTQFSPVAQLTFMVIGPMVDVKLIAMQIGAFGKSFALRFAPLVFCTGVLVSSIVGVVLLL